MKIVTKTIWFLIFCRDIYYESITSYFVAYGWKNLLVIFLEIIEKKIKKTHLFMDAFSSTPYI